MTFQEQYSLQNHNTFNLKSTARYFVSVEDHEQLRKALKFANDKQLEVFILGGGSNVLFCSDFNGLVIKNEFKGIEKVAEDDSFITLKIGSGENWHQTVIWAVEKGYGGIENLSLIPGLVGAAPIQNIGAYGVEIKDVLVSVGYVNLENLEHSSLYRSDCDFGYRSSLFKTKLKGQVFITHITITLTKKNHRFSVSYGAIKETLAEMDAKEPSIRDISEAVIKIRRSKLPDPKVIGNAGSFFKNPVVPKSDFENLKVKFNDIRYYALEDGTYKIPAAWLIEYCGFKGKKVGQTGSHHKQALVIVNHGNAKGKEIKEYANSIISEVYHTFGIKLEPEVNWIGC